jgi:superfamily II DNA or RNA helicase
MIELVAYSSRTFFSGPKKELRRMFHALRLKDKNAYFRQQWLLRKVGYFAGTENKAEREKKTEKLKASTEFIKFYSLRSHSFASGFLGRVRHRLEREGIDYSCTDKRKSSGNFRRVDALHLHAGVESRAEQVEAVNAVLKRRRGILHYATNAGKTEIAVAITKAVSEQVSRRNAQKETTTQRSRCSLRCLYLVHRVGLAIQAKERFRKHGIKATILGGGFKAVPKKGVLVATVQTASKLLYRRDDLQRFLERCDIVFVDELHVNKAVGCSAIMDRCEAPMRIGLSGTIDKKAKLKYMHYLGMCGPILSEVRNKQLVDLGRSAKPYIRFRTIHEPKVTGSYMEAYRAGIVRHARRNRMVVRESLRYVEDGKRVLITVARRKHGWILLNRLREEVDFPVQFIQGSDAIWQRDKAVARFVSGKAPILIVSPIFDVGVDLPEMDAAVFAGGGKSWEVTLQRLGRTLRRRKDKSKVFITDFMDMHNSYLRKHSKRRLRHYRDEQIAKIIMVDQ